ncbi:hypothetical protein [Candidatus Aalborgicola defluviihabitans]|uniref:hypothetical protein n=1 Tax=Candidatus Aalborgicola defluviihabitans TaxID=3386187 RepID=UPI0039B91D42
MAQYKIKPLQIGPSLGRFLVFPCEAFNPSRIRSEMLHGALKREFRVEQGWIPLEESPEGLVIMCMDPEAVRGSRLCRRSIPYFQNLRTG